jgi:hypothetical protein
MDEMELLRYMVTIEGIIETNGWAVQGVFPTSSGDGPPFSYTVGLWKQFRHPELVITGLDPHQAQPLLNDIGTRVKGGTRFSPGARLDDVIAGRSGVAMPVMFIAVLEAHKDESLGVALRYYGSEPFEALQVLWPDTKGVLPVEPGFEEKFRSAQPVWSEP